MDSDGDGIAIVDVDDDVASIFGDYSVELLGAQSMAERLYTRQLLSLLLLANIVTVRPTIVQNIVCSAANHNKTL